MKNKLYYPDFDRHKNLSKLYPDLLEIYKQPIAFWYGRDDKKPIKRLVTRINRLLNRAFPDIVVLVVYSIPDRDLDGYSKGGEVDNDSYIEFINNISMGIGKFSPIVIFEPDALSHVNKMNKREANNRIMLIRRSLDILRKTNAKVYVDIGHPGWLKVNEACKVLRKLDKNSFDGFSVNVSNFRYIDECLEYGNKISKRIKKNFVIDTSRNGLGSADTIFNPTNIAIGEIPTLDTGHEYCDAFLWIKPLGESDGKLNGSPKDGRFYLDNVLKVIENSKKIGSL